MMMESKTDYSSTIYNDQESSVPPDIDEDNWIFYSIAGSILFTSCNLFLVELSKDGLYGYMFFCYGTLFATAVFFINRINISYSKRKRYFKWSDLYIINKDTGKYRWFTIFGLASYSVIY